MIYKKFDLQLFAEDSGANGDSGSAGNENQGNKQQTESHKSEPKYTDEDVNKLIDKKFAEWQKKQDKAVKEAEKLAEMNATQRAEYQRDQLQKQLDDYKRKDSLFEMSKTARKMLSDEGISVPDELLSMIVTTDAEETKAAIDSFAKVFNDAVESAVKAKLKGETPRRGTNGSVSMTKEQIMAIKDPELRQKKMLENKELFKF